MNPMKLFMGRRQFLAAAGVTSVLGFGSKRLLGVFEQGVETSVATAAERSGAADVTKASNRYRHLLLPLKIRNTVLKNRMMQTVSFPHFMQGPETFPTEQIIYHYENIARNGAAIVMFVTNENRGISREQMQGEGAHFPIWNCDDLSVQHYFAQVADAVHFHDSLACMSLGSVDVSREYNISNAPVPYGPEMKEGKEAPVDLIQKGIEDTVKRAKLYKYLGYDMVHFHMSYHNNLLAFALSPVYNKRTDKYGGSLENRARMALELFQAIKKACGQDFLIVAHMSGVEGVEGGYTIEDTIQYAKIWEGSLDILKFRGIDEQASHPSGYDSIKGKPVTLPYAQSVKASGLKMVIGAGGGYQDLDFNEEVIASGKMDIIAMARAWIVDPEYGKKAYEGRGEDVVPCVRCGECSGGGAEHRTPMNLCLVNPWFGIAHKVDKMIDAPEVSKKVAIIGGGPAGMKAAITAAGRGHKVTLYEKNDFLGGQLRHSDFASFKWPYKDYKDYLIRQVYKVGVEVLLNASATPEMIKKKEYDAVVVAAGAEPVIPDEIPGAKGSNVLAPVYVYGNKILGKNIVVIGNDQLASDTRLYLTENGHKVTAISDKRIAADFWGVGGMARARGERTDVTVTGISKGKVTYVDSKGVEKSIQADNVVISAGRMPRQDEAMKFAGTAAQFTVIGDCRKAATLWNSIRTAYAAASHI